MGRPALTIALITKSELVRADVPRLGQAPVVYRQDRPDFDGLGLLVDTALRLSPSKPGKKIAVLTEDVWGQILKLPAAGVRGAEDEQVRQAIAFEAEPISGIGAFESAVGFSALGVQGGQAAFLVNICLRTDRDECQRVVENFNAAFLGLSHPGGLPEGLSLSELGGSFLRVELWADAVYAVRRGPEGLIESLVLDGAPGMGLWRQALDDWAAEIGPFDHRAVLMNRRDDAARGLASPSAEPDPSVSGEVLALVSDEIDAGAVGEGAVFHDLGDPLVLGAWLGDWAGVVLDKGPRLAALVPAAVRPMGASPKIVLGALLAALACGACWLHHRSLDRRVEAADAALKALRAPQETLTRITAQTRQAEAALAALEPQVAELEVALCETRGALDRYRVRFPGLLRALATRSPPGLVINTIETVNGVVALRGVGLDAKAAARLAEALTAELEGSGWRIDVPSQTGLDRLEGGGPFAFELKLSDPEPAAGAANPRRALTNPARAAAERAARGARGRRSGP